MISRQAVTIDAPAKINLGLEILEKRADGFHEIRSVMVMLDLVDTLEVYRGEAIDGTELPLIQAETNLIAKALAVFRQAVPGTAELGWNVVKRIPVAAGLGGASSDAAAALIAANELSGNPLPREELGRLGETLGSDVAFFLGSPAAEASGRGTDLAPLPAIDAPVTLLVPADIIAGKTRRLYSMIVAGDMTDGSRSARARSALERRSLPAREDLANAFSRPLSLLVPNATDLLSALDEVGVERYGLSGAGPAHYVIGEDACDALASLQHHDERLIPFRIIPTRTRTTPLVACSSITRA